MDNTIIFDDLVPAQGESNQPSVMSFDDLIPDNQGSDPLLFEDLVPADPQSRIQALLDQESGYQQSLTDYQDAYLSWQQTFMDERAVNPWTVPSAAPRLPAEPMREQGQLISDLAQGIPFIKPRELAGLIGAIETGKVSPEQSLAFRKLLADQLGPEAVKAFDLADKTSPVYQQLMAEQEAMSTAGRRGEALGRALSNSATLGYAFSPDEERLNSGNLDEAARERALQLMRETEGENFWGSRITGDLAGFMVPYLGAVKMLRAARAAKGLAPVGEGIGGAMLEGMIAGGAVDLATRPQGAESMSAGENIAARLTQAGIGAAIGAAADVGILKTADWIKFRMQARRDKKLQAALTEEAKGAGYENPDDYLDSLVDLVDTGDGVAVRGRKAVMDDLPDLDDKAVAEASADMAQPTVQGMAEEPAPASGTAAAEPVDQPADVSAVSKPASRYRATTIRGTAVDVDYEIVEADDLVTSHLGNGVVNPDYPSQLQPRDRTRATSEAQLRKLAANLRPEWLGMSPKASDGAPIVGGDAVVESGNGRVSALRYAYATGNGDSYRAWLKESAGEFGLDPAAIDGMKKPVLIRRRNTPMDDQQRAAFAREANQSDIASLSPSEQARMDAERLTDEDLLMFAPDEHGNINHPQNYGFLRRFADRLGELEAGGLIDKSGRANSGMVKRVQAAIFTRAYDDDRLLSLMAEEADPDSRNLLSALNQAAPSFARARSFDTALGGESNLVPNLMEAVELVRQSRRDKQALSELLDQGRLMDDLDPTTEQLARFFDGNMRSGNRMGQALKELGQQLEQEAAKGGADLFGAAPASKQDFINSTNRNLENRYGDEAATIPPYRQSTKAQAANAQGYGLSDDALQGRGEGQPDGVGRAASDTSTAQVAEPGALASREAGAEPGQTVTAPAERAVDVADGSGSALGKRQDRPGQSTLYSNPFGVASREIAQQLGLEQGIAAAGGGAYGGISSDNELGSAKWWLDVAAGAGAAALGSAGLKYTGVTGKDGFLSRHLSRLGNAIDELPLIGRGSSEIRELKERQQLMKQVLDRQTDAMGSELLKRFTPAERAMMADLIENKGIIKDYNLIHRQAAELDEFITYSAEKMKELGMLPKDLETGGYLHRYYTKHLTMGDPLFKGAKRQTLGGSYSIARGADDTFDPEYLSADARELVGKMDTLNGQIRQLEGRQDDMLDAETQVKLAELREERKALQETGLREYQTMENGQVKSFIFTENEVANIPGKSMDEMVAVDRKWQARGTVNGKAMLHRDWTEAERASWGEIKDAGYRFVRGQAEVAHDLSLATFFKKVADNPQWSSKTDPGGWHYVSDQKVNKNSPLTRYGALSGMYVDPKIWAAVRHHGRAPFGSGPIATTYRGLLNRWKLYKTVYNPVTHFNNTWSNTEMYLMAGYEGKHLATAIKALRQGESSELWRDARDSGLFGQDWSNSILQSNEGGGNSVLDGLAEKLRTQPDIPDAMEVTDTLMRFKEWWINSKQAVKDADTRLKTGVAMAKAIAEPASMLVRKPLAAATQSAQKLYQLEDELFKLAAFAQERAAGSSRREAVNAANRFFFNYNDLPEAVKMVRDFPIGSPFISYSYLAIPAIARNIVERPERILALAAMYEAVNFAGMTVNDDLEAGEYWQRLSDENTLSPKWNKGRTAWGALNAVSIPYLEGYRMSFANAHALGNPFAGEAGDRQFAVPGPLAGIWGSDIFGSNPLRSILDVVGNEDWKGKEIVSPEASSEEKAKAYAAYLYQAWAPSNPLTPGSYHQERIIEGMATDVSRARAGGEDPNPLADSIVDMANAINGQLGFGQFTGLDGAGNEILTRDSALASVGIKFRPQRPDQFMQFEIQDISDRQQKLDSDLKKAAKLMGDGKLTQKQLDDKTKFHEQQTAKYTAELERLIDAWNGLQKREQ